jgi:hypothetical protein
MITRLQFFARMRKLGYSKSRLQMARNGVTYECDGVMVTVPKGHEQTFTITGSDSYDGIFRESVEGQKINWGTPVPTVDLGLSMLEVCLGLCSGEVSVGNP